MADECPSRAGSAEPRADRACFCRSRGRAGVGRGGSPAPPGRCGGGGHERSAKRRAVSGLPLTRRAVDLFDHPGLFVVRLGQPKVVPAVEERLASLAHERPGSPRVKPTPRQKSGLHRYCSGCAHETEHVAWSHDGRASIPLIRWPAAEPAGGTTICVNCGQWRAACSQPSSPAWSSWPRKVIAMRNVAIAADSARTADDWVSEAAAENEGMPPKREPRRARRNARVRPVPAAAR